MTNRLLTNRVYFVILTIAFNFYKGWGKMDAQLKQQKQLSYVKLSYILIFATALLFGLVAYYVQTNQIVAFDEAIISFVQSYISPGFDRFVFVATHFGSKKLVAPLILILAAILFFYKKYALGLFIALTSGTGAALNIILKTIFQRERPDILPLITETGYSFPSGHSMGSIIFYGSVAYLIVHLTRKSSVRWIGVTAMILLIVIIGSTRIYLGVHFPSDIIGGFSVGTMWLIVCIFCFRYYEFKKGR